MLWLWNWLRWQKCLLTLGARSRAKAGEPGHGRMLPDLNCWYQLGALRNATKANDHRGGIFGGCCVQRCAAFRAKRLRAPIAAFRNLDVAFGLPAKSEGLNGCSDDRAKWGT